MKIINRGFIIVRPTKLFWAWANQFNEEDLEVEANDEIEPNVYLITEDFFEIEPIIEQNFKKIFRTELSMVTDIEEEWPEDRSMEIFEKWFRLELGSTVFDVEKSDLKGEKL